MLFGSLLRAAMHHYIAAAWQAFAASPAAHPSSPAPSPVEVCARGPLTVPGLLLELLGATREAATARAAEATLPTGKGPRAFKVTA